MKLSNVGLRVAGYIRVSTEEQSKEGVSLENQEKRIRAFAEAKEWTVIEIFNDSGFSGKNLKRPGMRGLIKDCQEKAFDVVIVYKVDRLTRKQKHLWELLEDTFNKNDIGFVSVTEPFDTTTAMGKGFLGMLGVFAQLERDVISERTTDALQHKKSKGENVGSPALGFKASNKELQELKKELVIVKEVKRLNLKGCTLQAIADKLNEVYTSGGKRGGRFYPSTVSYILKNRAYSQVA